MEGGAIVRLTTVFYSSV